MNRKYSNYFKWGVTAVLSCIACVFFFFILYRIEEAKSFFKALSGILTPITIGIVIAYLINPIVNFIHKHLCRFFAKCHFPERAGFALAKGISIFLALLLFVSVIVAIIWLILPELFKNILGFANNLQTYATNLYNWFAKLIDDNPALLSTVRQIMDTTTNKLEGWLTTTLPMKITEVISSLTVGIIGVVRLLFNIVIGLIVSVYVLVSKEKFTGQAKKLLYTMLRPRHANAVLETARQCNLIFSGFISGKLLDSLIIGILCFIGLSVFKTPYTLLVSVVIGVTNVIPFFGPYIGAIPSALLILLVNPKQCLLFLIFILILQQIDGNIIGPKILGDSTGLSAFWVVVSILVGGGLFGFVGMVIGVPTFAAIYNIIKNITEYQLRKKELPIETADYCQLSFIDPDTNEPIYGLNRILEAQKKEEKQEDGKKEAEQADEASKE